MRNFQLPGSPAELSWKGGYFLLLKQCGGAQKHPLGYPLPLVRAGSATSEERPALCQEGHCSRQEGWAFIVLLSGFFPCKQKSHCGLHVVSFYSVTTFLLAWALLPTLPSVSFTPATCSFLGAASAVRDLALLSQVFCSLVVAHISQLCAWPCITLWCALVYTATESVHRKYLTPLYHPFSAAALSTDWKKKKKGKKWDVPLCGPRLVL